VRTDAWAGNGRMMLFDRRCNGSAIGQDDDRALGVEQTDDVVVVGNEAASMRDVTQTRVEAYFEETKIPHINPGDSAEINL
jgi:hypothetical protein